MAQDFTGYKFGYLTAIKRIYSSKKATVAYWLCNCECGRSVVLNAGSLKSPLVKAYNCSAQRFDTRAGEPRRCRERPASYPYAPGKSVTPLTPDDVARGLDLL